MNLTSERASVVLTDDGAAVLQLAGASSNPSTAIVVFVVESDDLGLWIRVERDGQANALLLRWDYILSVEVRERGRGLYQMKG